MADGDWDPPKPTEPTVSSNILEHLGDRHIVVVRCAIRSGHVRILHTHMVAQCQRVHGLHSVTCSCLGLRVHVGLHAAVKGTKLGGMHALDWDSGKVWSVQCDMQLLAAQHVSWQL